MIPAPTWTPSLREYHADPGTWSSSMVCDFYRSPAVAHRRYVLGESEDSTTEAMRIGSALDSYITDPEARVIRVNGPKQVAETQAAEPDALVVTKREASVAVAMLEAIEAAATPMAKVARELLMGSETVHQYSHRFAHSDIPCRVRFDGVRVVQGQPVHVALKTTKDGHPSVFRHAVRRWHYDMQQVFYEDGLRDLCGIGEVGTYFVIVDSTPPHAVYCYELGEWNRERGRAKLDGTMPLLRACLDGERPWISEIEERGLVSLDDIAP